MKEVMNLIDELETCIEQSGTVPLLNKIILDKEDILQQIANIKASLPEEFKQSKWIMEQRAQIIEDAKNMAAEIMVKAEEDVNRLVNENEIVLSARRKADELVEESNAISSEITKGTAVYSEQILNDAEEQVVLLIKGIAETQKTLDQMVKTLNDNKKEIREMKL